MIVSLNAKPARLEHRVRALVAATYSGWGDGKRNRRSRVERLAKGE
jgi:hypothetical protein